DCAKICSNGDTRATARATARIGCVIGITCKARENRVDRVGEAHRKFGERRLREDDRACRAKTRNDERILRRHEILEERDSGACWHVECIKVVLDDDRNAVKWPYKFTGGLEPGVELIGVGKCVLADADE